MQQKRERTVKTKIYPVPRIDVDALLAIEAAPASQRGSARSKPTVVSEKTEPKSGSSQRMVSLETEPKSGSSQRTSLCLHVSMMYIHRVRLIHIWDCIMNLFAGRHLFRIRRPSMSINRYRPFHGRRITMTRMSMTMTTIRRRTAIHSVKETISS